MFQMTEGEPDVVALRPTELQKPLAQGSDPQQSFRINLGVRLQHADAPHLFALLRARLKRPCCRAAEQRDEITPSIYAVQQIWSLLDQLVGSGG